MLVLRISCGLPTCTEDEWPRVNLGAAMNLEEPRWPSLRNETAPVSRREKPQGARSTPAFRDSRKTKREKEELWRGYQSDDRSAQCIRSTSPGSTEDGDFPSVWNS